MTLAMKEKIKLTRTFLTKMVLSKGAAVLISIFAAGFAWEQVNVSRIHNQKSVAPILQITPYMEGKGRRNGLYISNDGLGPAIIKDFSVKSGSIVANGFSSDRWAEVLATTIANPICFATAWPKGETVIRAGTEAPLIYITNAEGADLCMLELIKLIGGNPIQITIDYESLYGEKLHLSGDSKISSKTIDKMFQAITSR